MRTGAGTMLAARAHTTKRDAVLAQAIAVAPGSGLQGGLELWCGHILVRATHRTGNMVVVWLEGLCQTNIRRPAAHVHGGNTNTFEHLQCPVDASAITAWRSGCRLGATGGWRGGGPLGDMGPLKWPISLLQHTQDCQARCGNAIAVVAQVLGCGGGRDCHTGFIVAHGLFCCNNTQFCNIFAKKGRGEYNLPI